MQQRANCQRICCQKLWSSVNANKEKRKENHQYQVRVLFHRVVVERFFVIAIHSFIHSFDGINEFSYFCITKGHTNTPCPSGLVPAMATPGPGRSLQVTTPPHASQVPPQADSLLMLLQRYPVMWQGLLALKTDQAAVQMHFVFGNPQVASGSLPCNSDGSTPPLRIAQRMRLEQTQLEGVARKMQVSKWPFNEFKATFRTFK